MSDKIDSKEDGSLDYSSFSLLVVGHGLKVDRL
jgi:hypothetical protein